MSTNSNDNKVILSDDLILLIFSFIENPFHNSIPLSLLFCDKEDYIRRRELYNIYCNLFHSCKRFYPLKYKDSYFFLNKEYSKKYNDSEEFKKEVSNRVKVETKYFFIYTEFFKDDNYDPDYDPDYDQDDNYDPDYDHVDYDDVDYFVNCDGEKILLRDNACSIHKLQKTYKEVLVFMKLENTHVTRVTREYILSAFHNYVKKQKAENNPDIFVVGDNRRFRLIGDLKILFDFIKQQMITRGDLENPEEFPEHIAYTQILKYLKYCFPQY